MVKLLKKLTRIIFLKEINHLKENFNLPNGWKFRTKKQ